MAEIRKEIPSWTIDWVNTVFTLLNDVDFVDDLWIDWAIYTSFTRIDKVITLTDAPIVSIFVDYKSWTTTVPVDTDCTFWSMKTKVWKLLGQKSTSVNFSPTIVWDELNLRGREIWRWRVVNKLNPKEIFRAWDMYPKDGNLSIRIKAGWILTDTFDVWDTEALTDTTNLLGSWFVEIWWDTVSYSSKISTQIDWTTGQTIWHLVWERVLQLYEMPVDMDKIFTVEKVIKWQDVRKINIPLDNTDTFWTYYQIVRTWTTILLKVVWLQNDDLIKVSYVKKFTNMSADTDACPFPDDYGISVLAYIVAGSLWYDKWIPNSQQHLNSGYTSLQVMYWDFNNETYVVKQRLQPKAYGFSSLRRF